MRSAEMQYDRMAGWYDRWWCGYVRRTTAAAQGLAAVRPGERVLDVGCGTGALGARLLRLRPEQPYAGVDPSAKMLAAAREKLARYPNVQLYKAEAAALPFAEASFDAVASVSALRYFARPQQALAEMRRTLHPKGRLVLVDWCADVRAMRLADAVLRRLEPAHRRVYTAAELRRLLGEAGFAVRHLHRFRAGRFWRLMAACAAPEA